MPRPLRARPSAKRAATTANLVTKIVHEREHPSFATCGDFGGKNMHGQPCIVNAGFGVPGADGTGPCKDHTPEAMAAIATTKQAFLDALEDQPMTVRGAATKAGVTYVTIFRWRQNDPEFAAKVAMVLARVESQRVEIVKDSMFLRIADPKSNADPLRMFYLMNKAPHEFQDRRHVKLGGDGTPIMSANLNVNANFDAAWDFGAGRVMDLSRPIGRQIPAGYEDLLSDDDDGRDRESA
jgi:hypothetical protein